MIKDEKKFALRDNVKIVEPNGQGAIVREISLFFPLRWWARLFSGTVRKITIKELAKINKSIKCAAEKVHAGNAMSDDLAKTCYRESAK